jgi:alpha-beta hydrolase superfamily lysophospholipase
MKWLILRGLVREKRHWGDFPVLFESRLKTIDAAAEVHCIDLPGFGSEYHRPSPFSISEIVDDLRSRWLVIKKPGDSWSILAISLGGMVTMNWASRYPQDFEKVVLINSSMAGLSPLFHRMLPRNYPTVISLLLKSDLEEREKSTLGMTTLLKGGELEARAKKHISFAQKVRKRDAIAQITAAIRFKAPREMKAPLLVLTSKGDTLVSYSCSLAIAKHYQGDLKVHETANHDMSVDAPDWICSSVIEWLS